MPPAQRRSLISACLVMAVWAAANTAIALGIAQLFQVVADNRGKIGVTKGDLVRQSLFFCWRSGSPI